MRRKLDWKVIIACLIIVYTFAFIGSIFTSGNTDSEWYESARPSITPPNYIFPIVWNVLFFLIALSLYFVWIKAKKKDKNRIIFIYGANLLLNAFWSYLYFGRKNPAASFYELIILWISIWLMIFVAWKIERKSAWLLVPYLLWVSFAGILNYMTAFP